MSNIDKLLYIEGIGEITQNLNVGGNLNIENNLNINNSVNISGDIIPTADNTYTLGSTTKAFKDVYIGPGSLYINGKKILEQEESTDSNITTTNITTEPDNHIKIKTSGDGTIQLRSEDEINLFCVPNIPTSTNGNIKIKNTSGGNIELDSSNGGNIELDSSDNIELKNTSGGNIELNSNGDINIKRANVGTGDINIKNLSTSTSDSIEIETKGGNIELNSNNDINIGIATIGSGDINIKNLSTSSTDNIEIVTKGGDISLTTSSQGNIYLNSIPLNNFLTTINLNGLSTLTVDGTSTFNNNVTIANNKTLTFGGNCILNDNILYFRSGTDTYHSIAYAGATDIDGVEIKGHGADNKAIFRLTDTKNNNVLLAGYNDRLQIYKNLTVDGSSTFNDNVTIADNKTLTVNGTSIFNSVVNINGISTFNQNVFIKDDNTPNNPNNPKTFNTNCESYYYHIDSTAFDDHEKRGLIYPGNNNDFAFISYDVHCRLHARKTRNDTTNNLNGLAGSWNNNRGRSANDIAIEFFVLEEKKGHINSNIFDINNNLNVTGTSTFNENVTIASDKTLTVNGSTNLNTLNVTGISTFNENVGIASGKQFIVGRNSILSDRTNDIAQFIKNDHVMFCLRDTRTTGERTCEITLEAQDVSKFARIYFNYTDDTNNRLRFTGPKKYEFNTSNNNINKLTIDSNTSLISRIPSGGTDGTSLMFKGLWYQDFNNGTPLVDDVPDYNWVMAEIRSTESSHYGGNLKFFTKLGGTGNAVNDRAIVPTQRMIIRYDGNVGINTSNPSEKLEVDGNIKSTGLTVNGTSTFNDNVTIADNKTLTVGGNCNLNDNILYFRSSTDTNHSIAYAGVDTGATDINGVEIKGHGVNNKAIFRLTDTNNNNILIAGYNDRLQIYKNLTVDGTSTFNDNVTIDSGKTLTVNGTSTFSETKTNKINRYYKIDNTDFNTDNDRGLIYPGNDNDFALISNNVHLRLHAGEAVGQVSAITSDNVEIEFYVNQIKKAYMTKTLFVVNNFFQVNYNNVNSFTQLTSNVANPKVGLHFINSGTNAFLYFSFSSKNLVYESPANDQTGQRFQINGQAPSIVDANGRGLIFRTNTGNFHGVQVGNAVDKLSLNFGSAGSMFVDSSGNLFTETFTSHSWKISAGILVWQNDRNLVIYDSGGSPIWSSGTNISDRDKKENIVDLETTESINVVKQLKTYRYNYIDDTQKTPQIGFMVDETKPLIPECIKTITNGDITGNLLYKENIVPHLVNTIQSLLSKVELLESRIQVLEGSNST